MIKDMLLHRRLPELKTREEMLEILQREEYGYLPEKPEKFEYELQDVKVSNCCAGKAEIKRVILSVTISGEKFSFPVMQVIPTTEGEHPFFIHINFRPDVPDWYLPVEEIIDKGFAVLSFCYKDVTTDDNDFTNGLAGVLYPDGKRSATDAGKISMWAWAAHRVMDYAETNNQLDVRKCCVCGHSRLGKTALLASATDCRFSVAYSNDSGCSGAAITRDKVGEDVYEITQRFPYWFCENYFKYRHNEQNMPFDQHYLLAAIAPRKVYVGSAEEDLWADPTSEFLCCVAAGSAFKNGFIHNNRLPEMGEKYHVGDVGYHVRKGKHYFSREDWNNLIAFLKK